MGQVGAEFRGTERYAVEARLGAGGFGVVYRALDRQSGQRVALKTLERLDPQTLYRFKREFRALAEVHHRNILSLHELVAAGDCWFFTMELVDGVDFVSHVRGMGEARSGGPTLEARAALDEPRLREALRQLVEGVTFLHRGGKLHRDLKPANVLVTREGRVVVLDFGLVKELTGERSTDDGAILGTPSYMAPEQGDGASATEASDWYGVGVMLYEALTGRLPHSGGPLQVLLAKQTEDPPPPRQVAPGVPEDLDALCMALLSRDPAKRPDGEALLRELSTAERSVPDPVETPEQEPPEEPLFVGRTEELARLRAALDATGRGRPTLVLVSGPSGIGKTALVRRFLAEARGSSVILTGRCYERESVPFKALDSLVDALGRHLKQLDRGAVNALVPRDTDALCRLFPSLLRVPALAEAPRAQREVEPNAQETRRRGFGAMRELITRMADRSTLVLHLDDLQ